MAEQYANTELSRMLQSLMQGHTGNEIYEGFGQKAGDVTRALRLDNAGPTPTLPDGGVGGVMTPWMNDPQVQNFFAALMQQFTGKEYTPRAPERKR